jgi:hypothetical protein
MKAVLTHKFRTMNIISQSSHSFNQILSKSQIQSLGLPIGSKVLIELTNPTGKVSAKQIGDEVGYECVPGIEFGQITILEGGYSLKLDSDDEEIIEAYEHLQELVNKGYRVRFALPSDRSTLWVWQQEPWLMVGGILKISVNCAGMGGNK